MSKRRGRTLRHPIYRWNVTTPQGRTRRLMKIGPLFDLAVKTGMDPGDYVMESAKIIAHLRRLGYHVEYVNTGETEDIQLDILD